jgi:hypothetical protein
MMHFRFPRSTVTFRLSHPDRAKDMPAHLGPTVKIFLAKGTNARCVAIASLRRKPAPADLKRIEASGCSVRHVAGDLVTLECDGESLVRLAGLPDVRSIELSGPLQPES